MTIGSWLKRSQTRLDAVGISTARLDCLVLLEDATGKDRAWLLAYPDFALKTEVENSLNAKLSRRAQHVPLAYIRGKVEFYGREFTVNEHTLVPRPETETIVDTLRTVLPRGPSLTPYAVIDIGTGSGAIAITAKLELSSATVIATDIDDKCLHTAQMNARRLGADIEFLRGNLLEPIRELRLKTRTSILLCNLPYVPDNFQINTAATHEPRQALFGGSDGLDLYRELFSQAKNMTNKPQYILTESLPPQHEVLAGIAEASGYSLQKTSDFIEMFSHGGKNLI